MGKDGNFIIIKADNLEEALIKGANYLKRDINECEYSIISSNKDEITVKIYNKSMSMDSNNKKEDLSVEERIKDLDGYFKIDYIDGYAYLSVFPPIGKAREVYVEDVINRMSLLNIPTVDRKIILDIIKKCSGKPEKLVLWPEGREYRATIEVIISDDKMSAKIIMFPPKKGGGFLTSNEIVNILNSKGIIYGINFTIIEDIVKNNKFKEEIEVARGLPPKLGKPSNIKYYFDINSGKPFLVDQYDRINYKELNFVQNKKKGDILAELIEPISGEPGFNIFGEKIEPPPIEKRDLLAGENTIISSDNQKIIAAIDGNVKIKDGKIIIQPLLELDNVDYSTGNIDFDGDVIVKGTVFDGFSIKANGIIQIGLPVGKCLLKSSGDILLKGGMNGGGEIEIETNSDIYARYLEGVNIKFCKSLFIEEAIMNCTGNIENDLILTGKRGEILGGNLVIGGNVRCKKIGNSFGVKTILKIGIDPKIILRLSDIEDKIKEKRDLLKVVNDRILTYSKMLKENNDSIIYEKYNKLLEASKRLNDEISALEKEFKEANSMLIPKEKRYLVVENTLYSSSIIYFGKEEYSSQKDISKIILKYINDRIIESGFSNNEKLDEIFNYKKRNRY